MNKTSVIGKYTDIILNFILALFTYPCWIIIVIITMCNADLHQDFGNYWSLITAISYYIIQQYEISTRLLNVIKGHWKYPNSRQYNKNQWDYIFNNILPLLGLPIAKFLIYLFPNSAFNTNSLTFLAMLITIIATNRSILNSTH